MTRKLLQALACMITLSSFALGATYSGTLAAPNSPAIATSVATWNGGPLTGAVTQPWPPGAIAPRCPSSAGGSCNLTVEVPQAFYASHPDYAIRVILNWAAPTGDLDIYVYDAAGNIYIAGIQAAPAGTEVWKSADGG